MQYVNDDMDDVFKRAGKEYSLNTNSADWNKIATDLGHDHHKLLIKKNKSWKYLLLLLLRPFLWLHNKCNFKR